MRKTILVTLTVVTILAAGWASLPYVAAYHIRKAIQTNDSELLSSHINFSAVRESMKHADISGFLPPSIQVELAPTRWSATFGRAASRAALSKIVDQFVTTKGVELLLASRDSVPSRLLSALSQKGAQLRYENVDVFTITTNPGRFGSTRLLLKREGLYWKVNSISIVPNPVATETQQAQGVNL